MQCWDGTAIILGNAGYESSTAASVYQTAMEDKDENKVVYFEENIKKGIKSIVDHLQEGRGIQVGVNYKWKAGYNKDLSTDHFILITSMVYDNEKGEYYFTYYEPFPDENEKNEAIRSN